MLILGNLYKQDDRLWVIVLSSNELDGYKFFKKTICPSAPFFLLSKTSSIVG